MEANKSARLILVALSQIGNEETTKTIRVDFEYVQRLPVSFWSRFAMLANIKTKKAATTRRPDSRETETTFPISNVF